MQIPPSWPLSLDSVARIYWLMGSFVVASCILVLVAGKPASTARISGNSMMPTLYGWHYAANCPKCGWRTRFASESLESPSFFCRNCAAPLNVFPKSTAVSQPRPGERVLVSPRVASQLSRWDCAVVQESDDEPRIVKRLLGLPGEKVQFRNGDLYINGRRSDRTPQQMLESSSLVHRWEKGELASQRWRPLADKSLSESEFAESYSSDGHFSDGQWRLYHHHEPWPRPLEMRMAPKPITDWNASNAGRSGPLHRVTDIVVSIDLAVSKRPSSSEASLFEIAIELFDAGKPQQAILRGSVSAGKFIVSVDNSQTRPLALPIDREIRILVAKFDGRFAIRVGPGYPSSLLSDQDVAYQASQRLDPCSNVWLSDELIETRSAASTWAGSAGTNASRPAAVALRSRCCEVARISVARDLYLSSNPLDPTERESPVFECRGYFLVGDNQAISADSRNLSTWKSGVPADWLQGKIDMAHGAWWEYLPSPMQR